MSKCSQCGLESHGFEYCSECFDFQYQEATQDPDKLAGWAFFSILTIVVVAYIVSLFI